MQKRMATERTHVDQNRFSAFYSFQKFLYVFCQHETSRLEYVNSFWRHDCSQKLDSMVLGSWFYRWLRPSHVFYLLGLRQSKPLFHINFTYIFKYFFFENSNTANISNIRIKFIPFSNDWRLSGNCDVIFILLINSQFGAILWHQQN